MIWLQKGESTAYNYMGTSESRINCPYGQLDSYLSIYVSIDLYGQLILFSEVKSCRFLKSYADYSTQTTCTRPHPHPLPLKRKYALNQTIPYTEEATLNTVWNVMVRVGISNVVPNGRYSRGVHAVIHKGNNIHIYVLSYLPLVTFLSSLGVEKILVFRVVLCLGGWNCKCNTIQTHWYWLMLLVVVLVVVVVVVVCVRAVSYTHLRAHET